MLSLKHPFVNADPATKRQEKKHKKIPTGDRVGILDEIKTVALYAKNPLYRASSVAISPQVISPLPIEPFFPCIFSYRLLIFLA